MITGQFYDAGRTAIITIDVVAIIALFVCIEGTITTACWDRFALASAAAGITTRGIAVIAFFTKAKDTIAANVV